MVRIRLMRVGKRKQPSYRVVVADARSPRDGRIIEAIGHYNPRVEPSTVEIDNERALYWLGRGAQASNSVRHLLQISGAWTDFTGEPGKSAVPPARPKGAADSAAPATPKTKPKATPAASVTVAEDQGDTEEVAEVPEADDQAGAAPDAEPGETTE